MADRMTDHFHAHKDATTHDILSHKHAFHVHAREKTVVFVVHATGVYSVYIPRRIVGTTFQQSETASLTALRQALKNATTMNSNFAMRNFSMMRTTKTKYAAGFLVALCTFSILFSDQQRSRNLHFLQIADSDFDAFVCSDDLVCRAALFLLYTRLVVADILFLLRHNLGVVVEVVEVLQHLSREPNALKFVFVQLS